MVSTDQRVKGERDMSLGLGLNSDYNKDKKKMDLRTCIHLELLISDCCL